MKYELLLKKSKLAEFIPWEELKFLKVKNVEKDSFIYKDCDYSDVIFILSGSIVFCHNQINKYVYMPILYSAGDILGDALGANKYRGSIDYFTFKDSIVVYIPRETMKKWKSKNLGLVTYLYQITAQRDFNLNLYQYIRAEKGLLASIAFVIDQYSNDGVFLFRNLSQLSIRFNSTRKSMHYAMKNLEDNGIVEKIGNGRLHILDQEALQLVYEEDLLEF